MLAHALDGDADAPAVVLINGADSSLVRWPGALIAGLVDAGYRTVRYDHRDVGLSPRSTEPYDLDDLTDDAVGLLDGLGIGAAHVVGRSMGGMVGQLLALDHPDRVITLTLVYASPGGDLPGPDADVLDALAELLFAPTPKTREAQVAHVVEHHRLFAGSRYPFDTAAVTALAEAEVDRAWWPDSGHAQAVQASPDRLDRLADIAAPTLVVHGTADPIIPLAHADVMAERIPDARLVVYDGLGHELPSALVPELLPELLTHMGRRSAAPTTPCGS